MTTACRSGAMPLAFVALLLVVSPATGGELDISGTWQHGPEGQTWTFIRTAPGKYAATEKGYAGATGTATVAGNTIRIEYAYRLPTGEFKGTYLVIIAPDGMTGQATWQDGRPGKGAATFVRIAGPPAGADAADPVAAVQALVEKGEFQTALKAAERAVAQAPKSSEAYRVRALAKRRLGDLQGALADANRAIELDPANARAWNGRAGTRMELKDLQGALTDAFKALELDPKHAQAYVNAAEAYRRANHFKEALTCISRAIGLEPAESLHYLRRGGIHSQTGDSEQAARDYTKAIELNPQEWNAYFNRGNRRHALKDLDGAVADFTRCIEAEYRTAASCHSRALCLWAKGNRAAALRDLEKAVQLDTENKGAATALAKLRAEMGVQPPTTTTVPIEPRPATEADVADADSVPPSRAEEAILRAAGDAPTPEQVKALAQLRAQRAYALLEIARQRRDPDALELAIENAVSATQLVPDKAAYWFLLAQVYAECPDPALSMPLAEDAMRKAVELDGANHRARLFLGQLLFQQKAYSAALDEFERVLAARPDLADPRLLLAMGTAYVLDASAERGEKFLSGLLVKRPEDDCARLTLAILLNHQGRRGPAVAELKKVSNSPTASEENRRYAKELEGLWAMQPKEEQP